MKLGTCVDMYLESQAPSQYNEQKRTSLHIHLLSDTSEKRTYVCTLIFIIHVHIIFEILTIHTMYVVHVDRDSFYMYMYLN